MPEAMILEVLVGKEAGRQISVPASGAVLGRSPDCDITLDEPTLSRKHCQVAFENGDWVIEDLDSRMGVIINGLKLSESRLSQGDRIKLGALVLKVISLAGTVQGAPFGKPTLHKESELKEEQRPISRETRPTPEQSKQKEFLSYSAQRRAASTTGTRQLLGMIGSIFLFVGVFMPVVTTPMGRNHNYFQNAKGDGTMVLLLAVISFFIVVTKEYKWLWLAGLGSLGDILCTFLNVNQAVIKARTQLAGSRVATPIEAVQLQWGWVVLVVGAGLLIAVAVLDFKEKWYAVEPL